MQRFANAWAIFQGLLLESLPFLLLGVAIAALARWLVPQAAWVLRQGLAVPQADWATGTRAAPEPLYIRTHYAEENRRKPTWKARSRRGSGGGAQG